MNPAPAQEVELASAPALHGRLAFGPQLLGRGRPGGRVRPLPWDGSAGVAEPIDGGAAQSDVGHERGRKVKLEEIVHDLLLQAGQLAKEFDWHCAGDGAPAQS